MSDGCYIGLQEELERLEILRQKQAEKRCLLIARDIYKFLAGHPSSALHNKRITIHVNKKKLLEAKQSVLGKLG